MKLTGILLLAVSAGLATAQIVIDASGIIKCPKALAGTFCVGASLQSKTIATCDANGIGQRGLCSEFLAGKPPYGSNDVVCYQSSEVAGDASCVKDHVVYDISGNPKFTLAPNASTPTSTASAQSTAVAAPATISTSEAWETLTTSPCPLEPAETFVPGVPATPSIEPIPVPTIEPIPAPPAVSDPPVPAPSAEPPVGGDGGNATTSTTTTPPTDSPIIPQPAPTANVPTVPTSAAPVLQQAGAVVAVVAIAVACLL